MLLKYMPHMSVADIIFVLDTVIIMLAGIAFKSVTVSVYSLAALFVAARITDGVITMGNSAKSVFIATEKVDEISGLIIEKIKRGVTGIYSKGLYTGTDRLMLLCVVSPKELPTLVALVRERDKGAFIIIEEDFPINNLNCCNRTVVLTQFNSSEGFSFPGLVVSVPMSKIN